MDWSVRLAVVHVRGCLERLCVAVLAVQHVTNVVVVRVAVSLVAIHPAEPVPHTLFAPLATQMRVFQGQTVCAIQAIMRLIHDTVSLVPPYV